jgi:hypothetical protein|mmetsp:Transcript_32146/g.88135  ORF Transcript_32146/g.88135 Transcript_32146/m.88135 type:complete len:188 (+) Transcript_32146:41-604(+)
MTLGALCCGDNFCCGLTSTRAVSCWGGHSFTPPSGTFKGLACHGKAGVAIDDSSQVTCFGTSGYGAEGCSTGAAVSDVGCGFWGCCAILSSGGSLSCWGASTVYGSNSRPTYSECESMYGAASCGAVSVGLDTLKPAGTYTTVACGGKRAGHFCCAQGVRRISHSNLRPAGCLQPLASGSTMNARRC